MAMVLDEGRSVDSSTWTMVRHGPRWRDRGDVGVDDSVARVATIVRRNMTAVMDAHPCYLQLTAGSDSRMLLACARERSAEFATYTLRLPDLSGTNDARVAAQISKRVGVSHRSIAIPKPDPTDLGMWV